MSRRRVCYPSLVAKGRQHLGGAAGAATAVAGHSGTEILVATAPRSLLGIKASAPMHTADRRADRQALPNGSPRAGVGLKPTLPPSTRNARIFPEGSPNADRVTVTRDATSFDGPGDP